MITARQTFLALAVLLTASRLCHLGILWEGETLPLSEIGFLDAQRRTPGPYAASPLSETRTAGVVFRYSFYGSDANRDWIRRLHAAVRVGQSVRGFDLTVPDGLDRLAEAVAPLARARSLTR